MSEKNPNFDKEYAQSMCTYKKVWRRKKVIYLVFCYGSRQRDKTHGNNFPLPCAPVAVCYEDIGRPRPAVGRALCHVLVGFCGLGHATHSEGRRILPRVGHLPCALHSGTRQRCPLLCARLSAHGKTRGTRQHTCFPVVVW